MKLSNLDKESVKLAQEAVNRANQSSRESMQALNESLRSIIQPAYESMEKFNESMRSIIQPAVESMQIMNESVRSIIQPAVESMQIMNESVRSIIQPAIESAQVMTQILHKHFEDLTKKQPQIKKKEEEMLRLLGESGWYIDSEMKTTFLPELAEIFLKNDNNKADKILIQYYRSRLTGIEKELCVKHPKREKILVKAFTAHRRGDYEISIPLFLIQTDGICFDLVDENFFKKDPKSKKPILSNLLIELTQDLFLGSIYYPLVIELPISTSKQQRYKGWNKLNRHQIIHGEITDYGDESNSLKAISLLNYVSWTLDSDEVKKI